MASPLFLAPSLPRTEAAVTSHDVTHDHPPTPPGPPTTAELPPRGPRRRNRPENPALHVVDDAQVAGGIAADGMNINARPRRRVGRQDSYDHADDYTASHAFFYIWYWRVVFLVLKCFFASSVNIEGGGVAAMARTINNDKILRTWPPPVKHRSCRRAACAAPKTAPAGSPRRPSPPGTGTRPRRPRRTSSGR